MLARKRLHGDEDDCQSPVQELFPHKLQKTDFQSLGEKIQLMLLLLGQVSQLHTHTTGVEPKAIVWTGLRIKLISFRRLTFSLQEKRFS